MEEVAKELGLRGNGSLKNNNYVITLLDSDDYSRAYTILDNSKLLTIEQNKTVITPDKSELVYSNDEYTVRLVADMKNNQYQVIIAEN